jgi:hypothetical protein
MWSITSTHTSSWLSDELVKHSENFTFTSPLNTPTNFLSAHNLISTILSLFNYIIMTAVVSNINGFASSVNNYQYSLAWVTYLLQPFLT